MKKKYLDKDFLPAPEAQHKSDISARSARVYKDKDDHTWFIKIASSLPKSISAMTVGQLIGSKILKHFLGEYAPTDILIEGSDGIFIASKEIQDFKTLNFVEGSCDNKVLRGIEKLHAILLLLEMNIYESNNLGLIVKESECIATTVDLDPSLHMYHLYIWRKKLVEVEIDYNPRSFLYRQFYTYDSADEDGLTPLHLAAMSGNTDKTLKFLRRTKFNVNDKTPDGMTAIHFVLSAPNTKMLKLLLEHGASVTTKDNNGNTALHHAVRYIGGGLYRPVEEDLALLELLLKHGANLNAKNNYGKTPIDLAKSKQAVQLLQEAASKYENDHSEEHQASCDSYEDSSDNSAAAPVPITEELSEAETKDLSTPAPRKRFEMHVPEFILAIKDVLQLEENTMRAIVHDVIDEVQRYFNEQDLRGSKEFPGKTDSFTFTDLENLYVGYLLTNHQRLERLHSKLLREQTMETCDSDTQDTEGCINEVVPPTGLAGDDHQVVEAY